MDYSKHFSTTATPQNQPIPGSDQVQNSAGGFSFEADKWTKLRRFLILGSEGNTYYATERDITKENAKNVIDCIKENGIRVVQEVVDISHSGRAPKNDPSLFVLALCTDPKIADLRTRSFAIDNLPKVARIPTHLFHYVKFMEAFRGWGRLARRGVRNYYLNTPIDKLSHHVVKYGQRDGWSHRDLLRLAHPKTEDPARNELFRYVVKDQLPEHNEIIQAAEELKNETSEKNIVRLIKTHNLPMEVVPTERRSKAVYEAVMDTNGMEWLVRNLGNLTKHGVIGVGNFDSNRAVINKLTNQEAITKSRLHPIKILAALLQYKSGGGFRSDSKWNTVPDIVDALNEAFLLSFGNVTPTNKRILWGFDVSGSMAGGEIAGVPGLSPRVASAALGMVTYKVERNFIPMAFASSFVPVDLSRAKNIDEACRAVYRADFGGTDCSLPMLYALKNNLKIDAFVVSTDSETWHGSIHPTQALAKYRKETGINAKLAVIGMVSNRFTIADPNDSGQMDFVGFDTNGPEILSQFIRGEI